MVPVSLFPFRFKTERPESKPTLGWSSPTREFKERSSIRRLEQLAIPSGIAPPKEFVLRSRTSSLLRRPRGGKRPEKLFADRFSVFRDERFPREVISPCRLRPGSSSDVIARPRCARPHVTPAHLHKGLLVFHEARAPFGSLVMALLKSSSESMSPLPAWSGEPWVLRFHGKEAAAQATRASPSCHAEQSLVIRSLKPVKPNYGEHKCVNTNISRNQMEE